MSVKNDVKKVPYDVIQKEKKRNQKKLHKVFEHFLLICLCFKIGGKAPKILYLTNLFTNFSIF